MLTSTASGVRVPSCAFIAWICAGTLVVPTGSMPA